MLDWVGAGMLQHKFPLLIHTDRLTTKLFTIEGVHYVGSTNEYKHTNGRNQMNYVPT